jgi:hypothetical protein
MEAYTNPVLPPTPYLPIPLHISKQYKQKDRLFANLLRACR